MTSLSYVFNSVRHEIVCDADAISGLPGVLQRAGASRAMVRPARWCSAVPQSCPTRTWCRGLRSRWENGASASIPA